MPSETSKADMALRLAEFGFWCHAEEAAIMAQLKAEEEKKRAALRAEQKAARCWLCGA
jgi:hypothetical protein